MNKYTSVKISTTDSIQVGSPAGVILTKTQGTLEKDVKYTLQFKIINYSNVNILDYIYVGSQKLPSVNILEGKTTDTIKGREIKLCHIDFIATQKIVNPSIKIGRLLTSDDSANALLYEVTDFQLERGFLTDYNANANDLQIVKTNLESKINQLADSLEFLVSKNEYDNLGNSVSSALGMIDVATGEISLKVEKKEVDNAIDTAKEEINKEIRDAKAEIKITTDAISQNVSNLTQTVSNKADGSTVSSLNNKVGSLETSVNGITGKVSNLEQTTNTINGKVSSIDTRLTSAESKITETAITNTVKKNFYTKSETDSQITSKGYQTASQVQQTVNGLEVKVSQSGGYNLLRNTGFRTGDLKGWTIQQHNNPVGSYGFLTHTDDWGFPDSTVKTVQLKMTNQTGVEYGLAQKFDTTIGKKYTVSFYYASHRCSKANIIIRNTNGTWLGSKSFNPSAYSGGKTSVTNWGKISYTFTATESNHTLNIVLNDAQNDGYMWIAKPVIEEGALATEYSPHPSEIYDGITTIDKDGITVTQSNAKSKTTMSANGFAITRTDNNKDIFRVGSDGLLTLNGVFKCYKNGVNQTGDRLESSGAIMFGYNERGGNNPVFASGLWTNESMGYFSVGYTRADISDTNGCLWISPTSGNDGCRLTYSKAVGSEVKTTNLYFKKNGTIEFATNMAGMNDTDNSYTYLFDSGVSTKSLKCYNLRPRNIIPLANGTYNLGRAGARFKDTYTDTVSTTNHSLILGTVTDSGAWQTYGGMAINSATGYVFPHLGNGNLSLGSYSNRFHTLYSINAVNVSSDKRLKTDIHYINEPMEEVQVINGDMPRVSKNMNITTQDMYDFVKNDLKLASYRYKANIERGNTSVDYNFIAQDILYTKVGSEIVQLEDKEDLDSLLSYNQGNYISVVVGALQKEIELRDKQIANLEERLSKLESKLK